MDEATRVVLLEAMVALETRLMAAMDRSLQAVQISVTNLMELHHQSLLEQSKLNAEFAPRERVHGLATDVTKNTLEIHLLGRRIDDACKQIEELGKDQRDGERDTSDRFFGAQGSVIGYLVSGGFAFGAVILGFILAHATGALH